MGIYRWLIRGARQRQFKLERVLFVESAPGRLSN